MVRALYHDLVFDDVTGTDQLDAVGGGDVEITVFRRLSILPDAVVRHIVLCHRRTDAHECVTVRGPRAIDFVVNRGNDKIYIQSALRLDDAEKERQETLSLRKTGDFFKKIVITEGYGEPLADRDGIIRVGVITFMLDETFLKKL